MIRCMPSTTKRATAIASAAVALIAGGASMMTTSASAALPSRYGCPLGAVCIYPQDRGLNNGQPEPGGVYFSYGAHNLRNQFGNHTIVNNQYGGAGYRLCKGYGGGGSCTGIFPFGIAPNNNLTPINSIVLTRPAPCPPNHCPR